MNDFGFIGVDGLFDNTLFNQQWTRTFSQIYPSKADFINDWNKIGLNLLKFKKVDTITQIYILLMGKFANSAIFNMNEDDFKIQLMTKVMTYGPEFERKMEIQNELLSKTEQELTHSSSEIYNSAFNPSQPLSLTSDTDKIKTINQQNTTQRVRSVLDGYTFLLSLLDTNLVDEFLNKFTELFNPFVKNYNPLWYITYNQNEN